MKLRLPLNLRSLLLQSFLIAGITLASQSHARTITWNPTNPNYQNIDSASWLDENDQETTFQDGDDLIFSAHNGEDFRLASDITTGNIRFESGTSGKKNYWLSNTGGGRFLGSATITVAMNNTTSDDVFVISGGLFKQFTGHFVVDSCFLFQIGTNGGNYVVDENGVISIGETITANDGVKLRFELANNAAAAINRSFETKIILNGNTSFDTYDNFGFTIGNNGGGLDINGTATWLGNQNGNAGMRLTIAGELTGGPDSVFILNGPTAATAGSVNITNLARGNSYSGTLQVNANEGASANELHLSHENAAQFATIQLNGGGAGSSTFDKAGLAVLSIDTVSATIAGLSGNANSLITSSAAAALKVNNATDSTYDGTITGDLSLVKIGAGDLTLTNAGNTHAGTVIQQGTLKLGSTASAGSSLTINGGATAEMLNGGTYSLDSDRTLNIAGPGAAASLTGGLTIGGGTLTLDSSWLTSPGNSDPYFAVSGNVSFTADTITAFSFTGNTTLTTGTYLFARANSIGDFDPSSWFFFTSPDFAYNYTLTKSGTNELWLTVSERDPSILVWTGTSGDGVWNTTNTNWEKATDPGTPVTYSPGASVQFIDKGVDMSIALEGSTVPGSMELANNANSYTFSGPGSFSGPFSILKSGSGNVYFNLDNPNYTGLITLQNGILIAQKSSALGSNNIIFDGGTLGIGNDVTLSLSNIAIASGKTPGFFVDTGNTGTVDFSTTDTSSILLTTVINKSGTGNLVLRPDAASTFTGQLTSADGTLTLDTSNGVITLDATSCLNGGIFEKTGTNELILTQKTINKSSYGTLNVKQGGITFGEGTSNDYKLVNLFIDLASGTTLTFGPKTGSTTFWLSGVKGSDASITGEGNIVVDTGTTTTVVFALEGDVDILKEFDGNFILNQANYVQIGKDYKKLGRNSTIINNGVRVWIDRDNFDTDMVLNDGAIFERRWNALTLNGKLTIGDQNSSNVTATWDGGINHDRVTTLNIENELAGRADATFILAGGTNASGGSSSVSKVNLKQENSFQGTLQVNATESSWGNELHLLHQNAAHLATINLQGGGAGTATGDRAGLAVLSVDVAAATIAGLNGNANSLVTSTVTSALTVNNSADNIYQGVIARDLSLLKTGTGSLTLGNASTYTGGTTITQGTLIASNATALGTGNVTINGGTLQSGVVSLTIGGGITLNGGTVSLDSAFLASAGPDNVTPFFAIAGDIVFSSSTAFALTGNSSFSVGSYLFATANDIQGFSSSMYSFGPYGEYNYALTTVGSNELWLTVSGMELTWYGESGGSGNGTWAVNQTGWEQNGAASFLNDKSVLFGSLANVSDAVVDISGEVAPSKIVVSGDTNYTFSSTDDTGKITGTTSLTKAGTNTLTIETSNSYTGGTSVNGGILNAEVENALGNGKVVVNGGTLNANAKNILGSGSVTVKAGTLNTNVIGALGSGDITLEGGNLVLNAAGDLITSGSSILFNGGQVTYASGADQDLSTLIAAGSTHSVNINTGGLDIEWFDASLNSIGQALNKTGTGSLSLIVDGALTQTLTVSQGSANLGISVDSIDLTKIQGTGGTTALINNNTGNKAINLTGTSGYAGTLSLKEGTSNQFSITDTSFKSFNLDKAELTFNANSNSTGTSLTSDGSGTLIKKGTGTLTLDTFSNLKKVDITQGELAIRQNGATVNDLHVRSTLTLGSNSSGMASSPVAVNAGNAYFYTGSTLNMVVPSSTAAIIASGNIYLPDAMTVRLINYDANQFATDTVEFTIMTANGSYFKHDEQAPAVLLAGGGPAGGAGGPVGGANDILIADGTTFTGWLSEMDQSISAFYGPLQFHLVGNSVVAKAEKLGNTFAKIANTSNGTAGANLLWAAGVQQSGSDLANLMSAIITQNSQGNRTQANNLMAASVGSTYMGLLTAQKADFRYQQNLIRNRMTGMGLNQGYTYREELPLFNAWIQGNGFYDKLDSDGDMAGHDLNTWGGTVGFDMNVTPSLTFGAAMTASYGDLKSSAGADSLNGDLDMYYVNLFAKYIHKRWAHSLILTGAWGEADVNRTVNYGTGAYSSTAKSDANAYGVFYELTRDFYLNKQKTAIFQPIVNAGITCNRMDGFSEKSTGNAGINVDKIDQTTGTIGLGGRLLGAVGNNIFGREAIGELRALLVQDLGSDHANSNVSYQVNPGFSQRVRGAKIGRTGVELGAGLTVPVGQQSSIFADATVDLRDRATSVYGTIGYRYNF